MPIFNIQNQKLSLIKEKAISLEKDIQKLTEENLETIFGFQFVSTEFALQNFRIDTLAFDKETKAFIIIEYKRDRSFSIIDQGYSYLALMLNNKADFILEYNEKTKSNLKRGDVDWTQSRVLFLAQTFTTYQQNAINFRDLPLELWEVKVYGNSTILYNQILSSEAKESIKTITKNKDIEKVSHEVKVYTLEDHLNGASEKSKNLFSLLRDKILSLGDDIEERPQKLYVAFRTQKNFTEVEFQREKLKIHTDIPQSKLDDPKRISRDVKNIGHFGTGETEIILEKQEDVNYVFTLVEQAYQKSKS